MTIQQKSSRFRILDSLRGLAAMLVVLHHFMVFNEKEVLEKVNEQIYQLLQFLSSLNYLAVLFFFVLSGFSIGYSLKGKLLASKAVVNDYLYKLFRRIIPIYLLALLFSLVVGLLLHETVNAPYSIRNLLGNLVFLQTSVNATNYWFSPYGQNGPLWSLAYELYFYLFLPVLSYLLLRYRLHSRFKILGLLFLLSLSCIIFNKYVLFVPILSFLTLFIVWWIGFYIVIERNSETKSLVFWALIFLFGCSTQLLKAFLPSATISEIGSGALMGLGLYLLFLLNDVWSSSLKNWIKNIFNFFFEKVGHGSYALYALHYPLFIFMSAKGLRPLYQIFFTFVLLIFCIFIEKWTVKQKFLLFKLNYFATKNLKVG